MVFTVPLLNSQSLRKCHVLLPGEQRACGAVIYNNQYYVYVRLFPDAESAQRGVDRLQQKGHKVVLTETHRGLVLWVREPDARPAVRSLLR
jgi:hypothetical protein